MQIQADGKILIAGYDATGWRVERLTAAGVLDTTFNGDGAYTSVSGEIFAMQIQADGKILIAGYDDHTNDKKGWRVERLLNNINPLIQIKANGNGGFAG